MSESTFFQGTPTALKGSVHVHYTTVNVNVDKTMTPTYWDVCVWT